MFKQPRSWQSPEKHYKILYLTKKYRDEQFVNDFYALGDRLYCKFCQHNVKLETCGFVQRQLVVKSLVKKRENIMLHTLFKRLKKQQPRILIIN